VASQLGALLMLRVMKPEPRKTIEWLRLHPPSRALERVDALIAGAIDLMCGVDHGSDV
jgi:hypothetical protein